MDRSADSLRAAGEIPHGARAPALSRMLAVVAVVAAIVVLRALPYLVFPQIAFDSDQAIIGLMAKHLSEGRAFPLFLYGEVYLLAVEAWAAAPVFALAGPTVESLRISMVAWNVAAAALLIVGLTRGAGLRAWEACVAALFFAAAPPAIGNELIGAIGGNIEPFVYIPLLWLLRERPLWFGVVLGIGFRNREFTLYAVPSLLIVQLLTGNLNRQRVRGWLLSLVMFVAVWESVEALKPFADLKGPGTHGELLGGYLGSQVTNLVDRINWNPSQIGDRARTLGPALFAWFTGASQMDSGLPVREHGWLAWIAAAAVLVVAARVIALTVTAGGRSESSGTSLAAIVRGHIDRAGFALYCVLVGVTAISVFIASKPMITGYGRYALLGILALVGLAGMLLSLEYRPAVRRLLVACVIAWAAVTTSDNVTVLVSYVRNRPGDAFGDLSSALVARGIGVAEAGYWRAYRISFISQERVRVASTDVIRIDEYQRQFAASRSKVRISDSPCPGGEPVAGFYLCGP